jgi:exonuclease SbcD
MATAFDMGETMKLIHLSDLHLGKRVNEFSMIEDQEYILKKILEIIDQEQPDAVMIAGDVYDRSVPSAEAVSLLDDFLVSLAGRDLEVFLVSGNHDSAERLAFGGRIMDGSGIHIAPVFDGKIRTVTLNGGGGGDADVNIHMLPFIKPASVRRFYPDEEIVTYTDAVMCAIDGTFGADRSGLPGGVNIIVSHQFVTGASRSDSEEVSVGGTDNIDASVFEGFDYVALGHIHGSQDIGGTDSAPRIRYCGTPLKYSFSEKDHVKSVTVVTLGEKGKTEIRTVPLTPRHEMREIRGTYDELALRKNYEGTATDDYLHVVLTDENDVPDALARLRTIYPNIMKLDYDNLRTRTASEMTGAEAAERKSGMEQFEEFYAAQNGQPLDEDQRAFARRLLETLEEEKA